jgi:hypothetical protein
MKNSAVLIFLLLGLGLYGQVRYTVFKTVGSVQYFSTAKKQWETLKPKDSITGNTKIKCLPNAYFIIFDSKYRIYEVRKQGEFLVNNSIPAASDNTSEEMRKAVKFFVEQTFSAGSGSTSQKSKGAVYRGEEDIFPWDSTKILDDTFDVIVNLPKDRYPVRVTLADYVSIIYADTVLKIPSAYLKTGEYTVLRVGKKEIHLFLAHDQDDSSRSSNILAITGFEENASAMNYFLAISNCLDMGYHDTALKLINRARSNPARFQELMELLKDNELVKVLVRL